MRNFIKNSPVKQGSIQVSSGALCAAIDAQLSAFLPKDKGMEFEASFVGSTALGLAGPMSDIDVCVGVNSLRQASFLIGAKHVENWAPEVGKGVRFNALVHVPDAGFGRGTSVTVSFYMIDMHIARMIMNRFECALRDHDHSSLVAIMALAREVHPSDPKAFFYSTIGIPVLHPVG